MSRDLVVTAHGDLEIVMTRKFNAPRDLVFEAMTTPKYLKRWLLGYEGWTMTECEFNAHPGGRYRYVWKHNEGAIMGMGGTVLEVDRPSRMVQSETFDEAWYPGEAIVTTTFDETDGQTTMVVTLRYDTKEARDGVLQSPMEDGVGVSYNHLANLLSELGT